MMRAIQLLSLLVITVAASSGALAGERDRSSSPEWTRDLVIYEVAPKAFTSPNGPETGTFESLRGRLPYLQTLGVTAIWLTGHSLADPKHFYNIWTQYAVIEPDQLDPSLGTPEQFKTMIDEAHRRGIKVFLDVITHGVMPGSSLIQRHPQWFRGGSWGMADYDWYGGHTDLDDWWVHLWTDYVTRYGVDGYRLDVGIYRPDLWQRVRQSAAAAGHPIAIWEEGNAVIPGVTDFTQGENPVTKMEMTTDPDGSNPRIAKVGLASDIGNDIPGFYDRRFGQSGDYKIEITYEDDSKAEGKTDGDGALRVRLEGAAADKASRRMGDRVAADGIPDVKLSIENVADRAIRNVVVSDETGQEWTLAGGATIWTRYLALERRPGALDVYLPTRGYGSSILLSCHDAGWQGFPSDRNPRVAQGSRATFGYSFLFTPMIPIFMSGEEFDADFQALPNLSTDLYGGKNPGKGRWLYGAILDWNELNQPRHQQMLEDVKHMLSIRRNEWNILQPEIHGEVRPNLIAVPHSSNTGVPVPYIRWQGATAIIVLANRNTAVDAKVTLNIPLALLGEPEGRYRVTDVWNGGKPKVYSAAQLGSFVQVIKRDQSPRGGIGLIKIERLK